MRLYVAIVPSVKPVPLSRTPGMHKGVGEPETLEMAVGRRGLGAEVLFANPNCAVRVVAARDDRRVGHPWCGPGR